MAAGENYIRERFDIDELYNIGFIKTKTNFEEIENRIVTFFGMENIYQWDRDIGIINGVITKAVKAKENTFSDN